MGSSNMLQESKPTYKTWKQTLCWFLKRISPRKVTFKFQTTHYTTHNIQMMLHTEEPQSWFHGHYNPDHLQAISFATENWIGPLTIVAIYCPPNCTVKAEQFRSFYVTLGQSFLAGGDYNAKRSHWGSRLTTPRGRELFKAMQVENLSHVSTGEPTYWPSDRRKVPDLIDFGVVKRIPVNSLNAESSFDRSSDHSPVIITIRSRIIPQTSPPTLSTKKYELGDS